MRFKRYQACLPNASAPIPPSLAPAQAQALGYNTQTYGSALTLGSNWYNFNYLNITPVAGQSVQNPDGTVSLLLDPSHFGAVICSSQKTGSTWQGKAFGGGGYFESTFKFTPTVSPFGLPWPAFWSLDIQFLSGHTSPWSAAFPTWEHRIEVDFMQWVRDTLLFYESTDAIDWYGNGNTSSNVTQPQPNEETKFASLGKVFSDYHTYGTLWVPATPTSLGYLASYLDNIQVFPAVGLPRVTTWQYWDLANPPAPPPKAGTTAMAFMDHLQFSMILGTAPNCPMTILETNVWQTSDANNITQ